MKSKKTGKEKTDNAGKRPQTSMYLRADLIEKAHAMLAARERTLKRDVKMWEVWEDIVACGLDRFDPETGALRPPVMDVVFKELQRRTDQPTNPVIIIPPDLPLFRHSAPADHFATNEELYSAMDKSSMMLWTAAPGNECLHVNPALAEYTGHSNEDFLVLGWAEVIHPDDRAVTIKLCLDGFKTRKAFRVVYRIVRKDGLYGWIIDHAHPRHLPDGRFAGYIGTMHQVLVPGESAEILTYKYGRWVAEDRVIMPGLEADTDTHTDFDVDFVAAQAKYRRKD